MRSHSTARVPRVAVALAVFAALGAASTFRAAPAYAGKVPAKETAKAAPHVDLGPLEKKLAGSEADAIGALQSIAESGTIEVAPLVAALLTRGATPKVLEEALKTASKLKVESLSSAIAPYVQHRTEAIRHAAVRALLKTKGAAAVEALRKGLRSPDAVVRGTAATGLGALGARDALADLFRAFDHGVAEAGAALGQLCTPKECEEYAERTGKVAFDVMVTGFDQILFRPPSDIPDEAKIRLIGRIRELGTADAGKYLADVGERWPKEWSAKVKQAIESASHAIGGGSKK